MCGYFEFELGGMWDAGSLSPCTSQESHCGSQSVSEISSSASAEPSPGRSFHRDVATRYVKSAISLDDLRAQLENEILEYLMREHNELP